LIELPDELLLLIAEFLESESDISSLVRASARLYNTLSGHLYQNNIKSHASWALIWAAEHGNEATARLMIDNGADVNTLIHNETPLIVASRRKHEGVVRLLLDENADVNACSQRPDVCALSAAVIAGSEKVVQMLLERNVVVTSITRALLPAAYLGHAYVVRMLLAAGAETNSPDGYFGTALHRAALYGHIGTVRILLDHNTNVNAQAVQYHALLAACHRGHVDVARMLLDRGADMDPRGPLFDRALRALPPIESPTWKESHGEVMEMLLHARARLLLREEQEVMCFN
jgi:ankyrin repeat protein